MGSQVKKESSIMLPLLLGILAIGIIAYLLFRFLSGGGNTEENSLVTPPPREGSSDFGPLPKENVIGSDPDGPKAAGR